MAKEYDSPNKCKKDLIDSFSTYDQTVDVVSCWQSILSYSYRDRLTYFDRFPDLSPHRLTPDFTAVFNGKYGIVFEVKRTFPNEEVPFRKEIDQLLAYDNDDIEFKINNDGKTTKLKNHDIVLLLKAESSSNEVFLRLNRIIEDESELVFRNNLIFLEYFYTSKDRVSRYVFRKFLGENRKFRDKSLPGDIRLETILGTGKSLSSYPKHFIKFKFNYVLCNDQPPPLYMSVFLWSKVLFNYLEVDQINDWKRGNTQKIQQIELSIDELLNNINTNIIIQGNVRRKWVTDSLKFLEMADLATIDDSETVIINYRNLTNQYRPTKGQVDLDFEDSHFTELAHVIADRYCHNVFPIDKETDLLESKKPLKQIPLSKFSHAEK